MEFIWISIFDMIWFVHKQFAAKDEPEIDDFIKLNDVDEQSDGLFLNERGMVKLWVYIFEGFVMGAVFDTYFQSTLCKELFEMQFDYDTVIIFGQHGREEDGNYPDLGYATSFTDTIDLFSKKKDTKTIVVYNSPAAALTS
jgi:hypothetical protein